MKFQNPSMHGSCRTDGCTDEQPKTNMPCQLLEVVGIMIPTLSRPAAINLLSNRLQIILGLT